jgi:uncharacterized protein YbjT (DUF2867 family)
LVEWVQCDVGHPDQVRRALHHIDTAFFLIHSMTDGESNYALREQRTAEVFRDECAKAGVRRVVYLGGVAPAAAPSAHLRSRLMVGELLRSGPFDTVELRASMIVGPGSASWQLIRDVAFRFPVLLLPAWTQSSTCPVAIDDVVFALIAAATLPLETPHAWFDLPGPEVMTGAEVLIRVSRLFGRSVPTFPLPLVTPALSASVLGLATGANATVTREIVSGFTSDLLPRNDRFWALAKAPRRISFDEAVRRALEAEDPSSARAQTYESVIRLLGQALASRTTRRVGSP